MRKKAKRGKPTVNPVLTDFRPGLRMKGGIRSNPAGPGYIAIVHVWDNVECRGAPDEWRYGAVFETEDEALEYYLTAIRPELERLNAEFMASDPSHRSLHRRLE